MGPGEELPIPSNLEELVHERVDRLGAPGLEVARVVAALADPTVRLVEAAAGRRAETGLGDAIEARILEVDGERLRFTHPLLRSAVWSRATPAQRRSLHARLAQVAPSTEERARHLALATVQPSREIAAVVEEAAESAHARGAAAAAAELAELAVRLTPAEDVEDVRRRVLDCADRLREAGDGGRAIALLEQALEAAPPGPARAAVLVRLAYTVAELVDPRKAVDLYREALAEAEGDAGPRGRDSPQPRRPRDGHGGTASWPGTRRAGSRGCVTCRGRRAPVQGAGELRVPALPRRARHSARADGGGARARAVAAAGGR